MKEFASHSEEDITVKRHNSVPINTTEANKAAANAWGSYLKEKDMETISKMFDFAKLAER